ncbi:hypothetical protein SAMN04488570_2858 [Nocardioides scoriae]|uniref:Uncharacterized protein n=1 Tax=Nocardioides scoriae TaxID=642780 RepID=A0A1H1VJW4_9ACTN|nr:hypothetical protein SAMN04488570_2858 [Nocardioides scoriae]
MLREALLDDSKVRVSMTHRASTSTVAAPVVVAAPKRVVISREDRDKVLRAAVRDSSKVHVSLTGVRADVFSSRVNRSRQ